MSVTAALETVFAYRYIRNALFESNPVCIKIPYGRYGFKDEEDFENRITDYMYLGDDIDLCGYLTLGGYFVVSPDGAGIYHLPTIELCYKDLCHGEGCDDFPDYSDVISEAQALYAKLDPIMAKVGGKILIENIPEMGRVNFMLLIPVPEQPILDWYDSLKALK
jgi:hypothetical protein